MVVHTVHRLLISIREKQRIASLEFLIEIKIAFSEIRASLDIFLNSVLKTSAFEYKPMLLSIPCVIFLPLLP